MTIVHKELRDHAYEIATEIARVAGKDPLYIWNSENFQRELQKIAEKELERLRQEAK